MTPLTVSVLIPAPPERVWEDVSDLASHREWMTDARSIEFPDGTRRGVGTRMAVETRFGPLRTTDLMEVTAWETGRRIAVVHRGLFTGHGEFRLEAADAGGTRFTWSERIEFPWFFGGRLGARLARPVLRWVWSRNLDRLRDRFTTP